MKKLILSSLIIISCFNSCTSNTKNTNYYFIKGLNEYQKGNKADALENYQKAYNLDNKNLRVLRELGFIYTDLGNIEEAKNYYQKVLKIKPYDNNSLDNLLRIAYKQENYEDIQKYSEQILDKNSVIYNYSKLKLALHNSNFNEADIFFRKLINSSYYKEIQEINETDNKNLYTYYLNIVNALSIKKDLKTYKKLYEIYFKNKDFIMDYAELLIENSDITEAEKILLEASVDIDDNEDLLSQLANLYKENKNIKKYNEIMKILKNNKQI